MDMHGHYIPDEIAENFTDFFPEHDGLSYEEVLLQQESVYQSFQEKGKNCISTDDVHSNSRSQLSNQVGQCSWHGSGTSQEDLDEALARSLQELGDNFDDLFISDDSEHTGTSETPVVAPARASSQEGRHDDIDPDNMTFEELSDLSDTVGVESRGLSAYSISQLRTTKYRTGIFSKNKERGTCVICQMAFGDGDRLTTLPCSHKYHWECIVEWLKRNKTCPVCQAEVQEY